MAASSPRCSSKWSFPPCRPSHSSDSPPVNCARTRMGRRTVVGLGREVPEQPAVRTAADVLKTRFRQSRPCSSYRKDSTGPMMNEKRLVRAPGLLTDGDLREANVDLKESDGADHQPLPVGREPETGEDRPWISRRLPRRVPSRASRRASRPVRTQRLRSSACAWLRFDLPTTAATWFERTGAS